MTPTRLHRALELIDTEIRDVKVLAKALLTQGTHYALASVLLRVRAKRDTLKARVEEMGANYAALNTQLTEARAALTHEGLTAREWAGRHKLLTDDFIAFKARELDEEKAAHEVTRRKLDAHRKASEAAYARGTLSALDQPATPPGLPDSSDAPREIRKGSTVHCDFGDGKSVTGEVIRVDSSEIPYLIEFEATEVVRRQTWADARSTTWIADPETPKGEGA